MIGRWVLKKGKYIEYVGISENDVNMELRYRAFHHGKKSIENLKKEFVMCKKSETSGIKNLNVHS